MKIDKSDYQKGLEDMLNAVLFLKVNADRIPDIFPETKNCDPFGIILGYSATEIKSRIQEYENRVFLRGDEIIQTNARGMVLTPINRAIVTKAEDGGNKITFLYKNGSTGYCSAQPWRWWRHTGRRFPEFIDMWKKVWGDEEE